MGDSTQGVDRHAENQGTKGAIQRISRVITLL
jgi:hypothetical protein